MAATFGEWRRVGSPCGGGLVLWMRDLVPGAGWGVVDHAGAPKTAYHHLRRALAPIAVWMTDEGLGGVDVHFANDRQEALNARLRVSLYRDFEHRVEEVSEPFMLAPHGQVTRNVESLLGRFVDASWAYRFGPPAQDLIVASIERETEGPTGLIPRAFHLPAGRPAGVEPPARLGLDAAVERGGGDAVRLSLECRRFVYGMRIHAPGLVPDDDAFSLEPGVMRTVDLRPVGPEGAGGAIGLTALNMQGRLTVSLTEATPG